MNATETKIVREGRITLKAGDVNHDFPCREWSDGDVEYFSAEFYPGKWFMVEPKQIENCKWN